MHPSCSVGTHATTPGGVLACVFLPRQHTTGAGRGPPQQGALGKGLQPSFLAQAHKVGCRPHRWDERWGILARARCGTLCVQSSIQDAMRQCVSRATNPGLAGCLPACCVLGCCRRCGAAAGHHARGGAAAQDGGGRVDGAARQGGSLARTASASTGLVYWQKHHGHEVWGVHCLSVCCRTQRRCTTSRPTCATTRAVRTS